MALNMSELARVQIAADVTGTSQVTALTSALDQVDVSTQKLNRSQQAFMNQLGLTKAKLEDGAAGALRFKANLLGIGEVANPVVTTLERMGINGEHSFKQLITSGGIFRELLVLMHESLIMGNWSRFGGSLMVIAERAHLTEWAFTGLGLGALGAAAGVGGLVAALVMGERESTEFANNMSLTGGMAGITEGQFRQMAASISDAIPGAATKSRNALLDLIATGQFSGDTLMAVGRAATEMSMYTGQTAADVVKQFDDMKGNAAAWAEKMNDSYHFLTEAQYEYIEQLQAQGKTEAAEQAAANDLYQSLADNGTHNLGILERGWDDLAASVRGAFNAMMDVGRASTLDDQLTTLEETRNSTRGNRAPIDAQIAALQKQINDQQAATAAKARSDQVQQLGITANDSLNTMVSGLLPGPDIVKTKIAELKQDISQALAADPHNQKALYDQSILPQLEASIQKQYGTKNLPAGASPINVPDANGFVIPSDDTAKLQTQLTLMQQYAAYTHQSEQAVIALNVQNGKLKGFTDAQIAELKARAAQDDDLNYQKAADNENTALAKQIQGYQQTAGALKDVAKQRQLQIALMDMEAQRQAMLKQYPQYAGQTNTMFDGDKQQITDAFASPDDLIGNRPQGNLFQQYVDQAQDANKQISSIFETTYSGLTDVIVSTLSGGKDTWRDFALSAVQDMLKIEVETQILGPLMKMLAPATGGMGFGVGGVFGELMLIPREVAHRFRDDGARLFREILAHRFRDIVARY
jgi:lambda family phage tail tape measure protein